MPSRLPMDVVIGAGPLGQAVARELLARGRHVRLIRKSAPAGPLAGVEARQGDIGDPEFAREACRSAETLYLCAKPPYVEMAGKFGPIMDGAIEAAVATGAPLIYADSLYAYGPFSGPLTEALPDAAIGRKGRARAQMAAQLLAAHRAGKVQAAIGRASDFYGPGVIESSAGERVFGFALAGKPASVLGNPDAPHTYTFVADFAKALVTLGEQAEALGQTWLAPSAPTLTTREFVALIYEELGRPAKIQAAPRGLIALVGLFDPVVRELPEVFYQFEQPFVVDHGKFERAFGCCPTPHREAIRETLAWYRQQAD